MFTLKIVSVLFAVSAMHSAAIAQRYAAASGAAPKFIEVPLKNIANEKYYAPVIVGTPNQIVNLFVDSQWADTWILTDNFLDCDSGKGYNCYSPAKSVTNSEEKSALELERDLVVGRRETDIITLGDTIMIDQDFLGAYQFDESIESSEYQPPELQIYQRKNFTQKKVDLRTFDGVLGFGPRPQMGDSYSFNVASLKKSGLVEARIVSIYTRRSEFLSEQLEEVAPIDGGKLILGGIDTTVTKSEFIHVPVENGVFPSVPRDFYFYINSFSFDNGQVSNSTSIHGRAKAILSTRYNYIGVPQAVFESINQQFKGTMIGEKIQISGCDFSKMPTYNFHVSGKVLQLKPGDYALKLKGTDKCFLAFVLFEPDPLETKAKFTFGTHFMSVYYSVFDFQKAKSMSVGFARLQN